MANVSFSCPDCGGMLRASFDSDAITVECPACRQTRKTQRPDFQNGCLHRCLVCPSTELFVRKDFPPRLGVAIVVVGIILSSVFWAYHQVIATFTVLFATALIDVVLYFTMGNVLECYRCHAQYRGLPGFESYPQFDLEAHEKHRQQAIRLNEARDTRGQSESH